MKLPWPAWWPNDAGRRHREVPLDGGAVLERLDEALAALDQPTMDGINTYFVSWAAREVGLKVALSGLGGDELFAGYRTFADTPRLERLMRLAWFAPAPLRRAVAPVLRALLARHSGSGRSAQSDGCMAVARRAAASVFLHAHAVSAVSDLPRLTEPRFRPSTVSADGVTLEPTWLGWLQRAADAARTTGADRRRVVAGDAVVHGQHALA